MNLRPVLAAIVMASAPALLATPAMAEKAPMTYTAEDSNIALGGFDTVSYFSGTPVEGNADFTTTYKGAQYQFASQANLDTFLLDPAKFAPQYGGHCAYGASQGAAYPGDPAVYEIVDGKLYLNYNADVQANWTENQASLIPAADAAWPSIVGETPAPAAHGS